MIFVFYGSSFSRSSFSRGSSFSSGLRFLGLCFLGGLGFLGLRSLGSLRFSSRFSFFRGFQFWVLGLRSSFARQPVTLGPHLVNAVGVLHLEKG